MCPQTEQIRMKTIYLAQTPMRKLLCKNAISMTWQKKRIFSLFKLICVFFFFLPPPQLIPSQFASLHLLCMCHTCHLFHRKPLELNICWLITFPFIRDKNYYFLLLLQIEWKIIVYLNVCILSFVNVLIHISKYLLW